MSITHRYRAPVEPGVLRYPAAEQIGPQLEANRSKVNIQSVLIDGTSLAQFRQQAASELVAAARQYHRDCGEPVPDFPAGPLLMSGHQPELTHVGVLVKTFALHGLARQHGLTPVNLIVDNDTTKTTSLRFAVLGGDGNQEAPFRLDPDVVHLQSEAYDDFEGEVIYEKRAVVNAERFVHFAKQVMPLTRHWGFEPLLPDVWAEMCRQYRRTQILGEVVSATRRHFERRWDCHNLEIPLSRMCATHAFQRFVRHIVKDLPRFHAIYNECVADYRRLNHVRSRNHPVPDLTRDGDMLEAPFWRVLPDQERRSRLMVRRGEIPDLSNLRSRALTTTMFLRICLSDGFIHGIGGAKYDEVTDAIVKRWLGIDAPGYIVFTATFRLPLPVFPTTDDDLKRAARQVRDIYWNPQRHLEDGQERDETLARLLAQKQRKTAAKPQDKLSRRTWFRELASLTEQMRPYVVRQMKQARAELKLRQREAKANEALIRRDFAWCLFPEPQISAFCRSLL